MRYILYFIVYGLIFYAIYLYFPDAFQTLVGWTAKLFDTVKDIINSLVAKINEWRSSGSAPAHDGAKSLFNLFF